MRVSEFDAWRSATSYALTVMRCAILLGLGLVMVGCGCEQDAKVSKRMDTGPDAVLGHDASSTDRSISGSRTTVPASGAAKARSTLPKFISGLERAESNRGFSIEAGMADGKGGKVPVWITDLSHKDGLFHGRVESTTKNLKKGDPVTVRAEEITDWRIKSGGRVRTPATG